MDSGLLMDEVPLWLLFVASGGFIVLCWMAGFAARRRRAPGDGGEERFAGELMGAVLGLLAFLLALTFDMAVDRYSERQDLAREAVESIRTAWLSAAYAEAPERDALREALRAYVESALVPLGRSDELTPLLERADAALSAMVNAGERIGRGTAVTDVHAQVVANVQEVTSLHHRRVALGTRSRTPRGVIVTLYVVMAIAMFMIGWAAGERNERRFPSVLAFALSFSAVVMLISALDRPRNHLVDENQQLLRELGAWMDARARGP
jgi:hypothetical protein